MPEEAQLSIKEAEAMLPEGDTVHTIRQAGPCLIGADWTREQVLEIIKKYPPELSGPGATSMGHGIAIIDNVGPLFIETKK